MKNNGIFITFEGGEGVGKSTQVKMLYDYLQYKGLKVVLTREPGGTLLGESLRNILKDPKLSNIDVISECLLMFAARRQHYVDVIKKYLEQDIIIICDRFIDSTLVYQGILKGMPLDDIMLIKQIVIGDMEPDITFILDVPTKQALERINERRQLNIDVDAYDTMCTQYHDIIRNGFKKIAEIFSYRTHLINASKNSDIVSSSINKIIDVVLREQTCIL